MVQIGRFIVRRDLLARVAKYMSEGLQRAVTEGEAAQFLATNMDILRSIVEYDEVDAPEQYRISDRLGGGQKMKQMSRPLDRCEASQI